MCGFERVGTWEFQRTVKGALTPLELRQSLCPDAQHSPTDGRHGSHLRPATSLARLGEKRPRYNSQTQLPDLLAGKKSAPSTLLVGLARNLLLHQFPASLVAAARL